MLGHMPSLAALEADDDGRLVAELRLARLRSQAAVVRTLADHVEYLSRAGDADGIGDQLVEEMAQLACRLLEAAGTLARSQDPGDSGVFARGPSAVPVINTPSGFPTEPKHVTRIQISRV
jgi:hypothetical protein